MALQIRKHLFLLRLDELQRATRIAPTKIWRDARGSGICLDLSNQFFAAFLFQVFHLFPKQDGAHWVCQRKKAPGAAQHRT